MRILITGASGFLGQYLISHLFNSKLNNATIYSVGRSPYLHASVSHSVGDLSDSQFCEHLLETVRPTHLYHLAGFSKITDQIGMSEYFKQNTLTTQNLISAISKTRLPIYFFLASSVHVYGNQLGIVSEETPANPEGTYGFTKFLAEEALRVATQKDPQLRVVIGRLYSCFGPGQSIGFVSADLCKKILQLPDKEQTVLSMGPLDTFRRFIDARDVVQLFPKLLNKENASRFEIYNIASTNEIMIRDMVNILLKLTHKSPQIKSTSGGPNAFKGLKVNIDKLQNSIGPLTFRSLESSLKDMLEFTKKELLNPSQSTEKGIPL